MVKLGLELDETYAEVKKDGELQGVYKTVIVPKIYDPHHFKRSNNFLQSAAPNQVASASKR